MLDEHKLMLDIGFSVEFLEYLIVKLSAIIDDNNMKKFELAYDGSLEKSLTLISLMCAKGFASIHLVK